MFKPSLVVRVASAHPVTMICLPFAYLGVSQETIQLVRRAAQEEDCEMLELGADGSGNDTAGTSNSDEGAWEDVEMPVDESFRYAMRDASEILR